MRTCVIVSALFAATVTHAQVSLLWESPLTLGDKGALYAPATYSYPINYVLDTLALTARFYNADTFTQLSTMTAIGKYEYPFYVLPDMNGNGQPELLFANYGLPTYSVRIRDLATGATLQSWTDAAISYALWYVLTSPGSPTLKLAMLKTNINTGMSSLAVYSLGVPVSDVEQTIEREEPVRANLHQNFPNPFNPTTHIRYEVSSRASVVLEVFDSGGRLVRTFPQQQHEAGVHEVRWNGKDNAGVSVASGTYFYRLIVNGTASAKKMVLLR